MRAKLLPLFGLLALSSGVLPAQTADPEGPPPVLALGREEIKPGKMGVHGKTSAGYAAVLAKANPAMHWIGFTPVSGEVTEVNKNLEGDPALVNRGAETDGWFFKVKLQDKSELEGLMDKAAYEKFVESN